MSPTKMATPRRWSWCGCRRKKSKPETSLGVGPASRPDVRRRSLRNSGYQDQVKMCPAWRPELLLFFLGRPARFHDLPSPAKRERLRGHRIGNHTSGTNVTARSDFDWSHQRGVATDEGIRADFGFVLRRAVEVAGNGTRADVDAV